MKAVLDSNVALKWVLTETDSLKASDLRAGYQRGLHELLSPDIFLAECSHALTRAERKGILKKGEAAAHLANILPSRPAPIHPPPRACGGNLFRHPAGSLRLPVCRPGRVGGLRTRHVGHEAHQQPAGAVP